MLICSVQLPFYFLYLFLFLFRFLLGGITNVFVGQPLDTIKVKMQTFPNMYSGMVQCFHETLAREGIRGFYAGSLAAIVANVSHNSVLFAAYGICQKTMLFFTGKRVLDYLFI